MVFAFLVNSVPGYAAEGIDSLPVAGTVSIDNSVPADPSSISEAAFDTDLPDSRSSAPESESTSVPADISNETKPDDVIDDFQGILGENRVGVTSIGQLLFNVCFCL